MSRIQRLAASTLVSLAALAASMMAANPAYAVSVTTRTAYITNEQEFALPEVTAIVSCPRGYVATGGGYRVDRPQGFTVNTNQPFGTDAWMVSVYVPTGVQGFESIGIVHVICIR